MISEVNDYQFAASASERMRSPKGTFECKVFGDNSLEKFRVSTSMKVLALGLGIVLVVCSILLFILLPISFPYYLTVSFGIAANSLGVVLVTVGLVSFVIEKYFFSRTSEKSQEELVQRVSYLELKEQELLEEKSELKRKYFEKFQAQSSQISSLEEEKELYAAELITLRVRCEDLSQKNVDCLQKISCLEDKMVRQSESEAKVAELSALVEVLETQNKELDDCLNSLRTSYERDKSRIQKELNLLRDERVKEKESSSDRSCKELDNALSIIEELSKKIELLTEEKIQQKNASDRSCKELDNALSVIEELSKKIELLTEEKIQQKNASDMVMKHLSEKITKLTEENFTLKTAQESSIAKGETMPTQESLEKRTKAEELKKISSGLGDKVSGIVGNLFKKSDSGGRGSGL